MPGRSQTPLFVPPGAASCPLLPLAPHAHDAALLLKVLRHELDLLAGGVALALQLFGVRLPQGVQLRRLLLCSARLLPQPLLERGLLLMSGRA